MLEINSPVLQGGGVLLQQNWDRGAPRLKQ